MIDSNELLKEIKKNGYWEVIIRPTKFIGKRIPDKSICKDIIEKSQVSLRKWDYPHIDHKTGIFRREDGVESFCNWIEGGHIEDWKFYQNGMFSHFFVMGEDMLTEEDITRIKRKNFFQELEAATKFLGIINTLYTITKVCIFAANLAKNANFTDGIEIEIKLYKTKGRTLFFSSFDRILSKPYTCSFEPVSQSKVVSFQKLQSEKTKIALDLFIEVLKEFDWENPPYGVFLEDQKKFLEGRI